MEGLENWLHTLEEWLTAHKQDERISPADWNGLHDELTIRLNNFARDEAVRRADEFAREGMVDTEVHEGIGALVNAMAQVWTLPGEQICRLVEDYLDELPAPPGHEFKKLCDKLFRRRVSATYVEMKEDINIDVLPDIVKCILEDIPCKDSDILDRGQFREALGYAYSQWSLRHPKEAVDEAMTLLLPDDDDTSEIDISSVIELMELRNAIAWINALKLELEVGVDTTNRNDLVRILKRYSLILKREGGLKYSYKPAEQLYMSGKVHDDSSEAYVSEETLETAVPEEPEEIETPEVREEEEEAAEVDASSEESDASVVDEQELETVEVEQPAIPSPEPFAEELNEDTIESEEIAQEEVSASDFIDGIDDSADQVENILEEITKEPEIEEEVEEVPEDSLQASDEEIDDLLKDFVFDETAEDSESEKQEADGITESPDGESESDDFFDDILATELPEEEVGPEESTETPADTEKPIDFFDEILDSKEDGETAEGETGESEIIEVEPPESFNLSSGDSEAIEALFGGGERQIGFDSDILKPSQPEEVLEESTGDRSETEEDTSQSVFAEVASTMAVGFDGEEQPDADTELGSPPDDVENVENFMDSLMEEPEEEETVIIEEETDSSEEVELHPEEMTEQEEFHPEEELIAPRPKQTQAQSGDPFVEFRGTPIFTKVIEEMYGGDSDALDVFLAKLQGAPDWNRAKQFIANELFRCKVDLHSELGEHFFITLKRSLGN